MTNDSDELETVERYLDEHFDPIRRLLGRKIPDPDVRKVALRKCTEPISRWREESEAGQAESNRSGYTEPNERPPEQWMTGGESATERQIRTLEDHDVAVPEGCTKARASQLITKHVYGQV